MRLNLQAKSRWLCREFIRRLPFSEIALLLAHNEAESIAVGLIRGNTFEKDFIMKLNRLAAATVAAAAAVAVVSGCGVTHHSAAAVADPASPRPAAAVSAQAQAQAQAQAKAKAHTVAALRSTPADRALAWLVSPGGQAQVRFDDAVATLAWDLEVESHAPTVANHLVFEADARVVRAQARKILATPALLPKHNRAAYKRMLHKFIIVANMLQPGPDYGTTAQDYAAWYAAMRASNITVW